LDAVNVDTEQCGKDWHGIQWNVIFGHCNMVKKEEKNMNAAVKCI
jgi:hypothetical protein